MISALPLPCREIEVTPEVRVAELALDDVERHAFAGALNRVPVKRWCGAKRPPAAGPAPGRSHEPWYVRRMLPGRRTAWRAARSLLIAALVGAVAAQPAWAASRAERLQAVVDHLSEDLYLGANLLGREQAFHVPGAALTVSIPGRRPRTFVTGLAEVAGRRPMRRRMAQPIGSGTKPMVAVSILSLVEHKRLALGDRLSQVAAASRRDGGVLAALVRRYAGRLR